MCLPLIFLQDLCLTFNELLELSIDIFEIENFFADEIELIFIPNKDFAVTDLPDPDSPIKPTISPFLISKDTPLIISTIFFLSVADLKETFKSWTSIIFCLLFFVIIQSPLRQMHLWFHLQ